MKTMQAIRVHGINDYTIDEEPIPMPGRGEVLVKAEAAGFCRTDLKIIEHGHRDLILPRIPGEEVVGRIVEIGEGTIETEGIRRGERVYVYPGTSCGTCPPCLNGAENLCRDMRIMGFHRDGGFAEYVPVPAKSIIPVPSGLKAEEAVFAEPLSCCLNAVELGGVRPGTQIGIWGAGPAGTLIARTAASKEADCFITDPDAARLERALSRAIPGDGAFPRPMEKERHFDTAFVAVGSAEAYEEALRRLKPRGTLVVFSGLLPRQTLRAVDFNRIHYLEQRIAGAYGCSFRHGEEALRLITAGKKGPGGVPVRDMISHRFPFSRLGEALSIVKHRKGMKVMLYPDRIFRGREAAETLSLGLETYTS